MTVLVIKDVPEDLLEVVDARAQRLGLTRSEFIRRVLARERDMGTREPTRADLERSIETFADLADPEVMRQAFTFIGTDLTVDVHAEGPGTIRLTRGAPGTIQVAARAEDGFATSGLARKPRHHLNLTVAGDARVDYVVVVPAGVRVRVRLPDRHVAEVFGTLQDAASYSWEAVPPPAAPTDVGVTGGR
jgi:hypothetical protein